ncbi:MAG: hypothetical protein EXR36_13365 [Betaproteobacteria bacterium]|nr:hypothetical protein [Betaproteobacteria bacterium]
MKLLHASAAAFLASTLFILPAAAAGDRADACRTDVAKLCKDVKPGGGRMLQCMKQHESELSAPCKERMAQGKKRAEEFKEACKSDAEKLCKDTPKGLGNVIRCLASHKPELSSSCQQKIAEAQKNHPCSKDAERLCKDVKVGDGRMAQCMKSHKKDLSPACKSSLQKRHAKATGYLRSSRPPHPSSAPDGGHQMHLAIRANGGKPYVLENLPVDGNSVAVMLQMGSERRIALAQHP